LSHALSDHRQGHRGFRSGRDARGLTDREDGPVSRGTRQGRHETKERVAGYTLIQAKSREEAFEWTRHFPNPAADGGSGEIEVRQLFELQDFAPSPAVERFKELRENLEQSKHA